MQDYVVEGISQHLSLITRLPPPRRALDLIIVSGESTAPRRDTMEKSSKFVSNKYGTSLSWMVKSGSALGK